MDTPDVLVPVVEVAGPPPALNSEEPVPATAIPVEDGSNVCITDLLANMDPADVTKVVALAAQQRGAATTDAVKTLRKRTKTAKAQEIDDGMEEDVLMSEDTIARSAKQKRSDLPPSPVATGVPTAPVLFKRPRTSVAGFRLSNDGEGEALAGLLELGSMDRRLAEFAAKEQLKAAGIQLPSVAAPGTAHVVAPPTPGTAMEITGTVKPETEKPDAYEGGETTEEDEEPCEQEAQNQQDVIDGMLSLASRSQPKSSKTAASTSAAPSAPPAVVPTGAPTAVDALLTAPANSPASLIPSLILPSSPLLFAPFQRDMPIPTLCTNSMDVQAVRPSTPLPMTQPIDPNPHMGAAVAPGPPLQVSSLQTSMLNMPPLQMPSLQMPHHEPAAGQAAMEIPAMDQEMTNASGSEENVGEAGEDPADAPLETSTKYTGVRQNKGGRFSARIKIGGSNRYIGTFKTSDEAARAFDDMAIKFGRPVETLNFPASHGGPTVGQAYRKRKLHKLYSDPTNHINILLKKLADVDRSNPGILKLTMGTLGVPDSRFLPDNKYSGVRQQTNHWEARIRYKDKLFSMGFYSSVEAAALAWDITAASLRRCSKLNFPEVSFADLEQQLDALKCVISQQCGEESDGEAQEEKPEAAPAEMEQQADNVPVIHAMPMNEGLAAPVEPAEPAGENAVAAEGQPVDGESDESSHTKDTSNDTDINGRPQRSVRVRIKSARSSYE